MNIQIIICVAESSRELKSRSGAKAAKFKATPVHWEMVGDKGYLTKDPRVRASEHLLFAWDHCAADFPWLVPC